MVEQTELQWRASPAIAEGKMNCMPAGSRREEAGWRRSDGGGPAGWLQPRLGMEAPWRAAPRGGVTREEGDRWQWEERSSPE